MSSTHLNLARAVCRRAERSVYPLVHAEQVDAEVGRYLNRLSDFLFAATRAAALREGREELLWRKAVMPSAVADKANTAAALAAESFSAAGSPPSVTAGAAQTQTQTHSAVDHSADEVEDIGDVDLSQHAVQTPAGSQDAFHGFEDDFFDPSVASGSGSVSPSNFAGSILSKSSERSSRTDSDDVSITSKSSASSKSKTPRPARVAPKVIAKTSLKGSSSAVPPAAAAVIKKKPFTTGTDYSSPKR